MCKRKMANAINDDNKNLSLVLEIVKSERS